MFDIFYLLTKEKKSFGESLHHKTKSVFDIFYLLNLLFECHYPSQ